MSKYKFEQFAINCTEKKVPSPHEYSTYIGLEHMDTKCLKISRWGSDVPIIGEKLVMHKGDILLGKRNAYLRRAAIAPHDGVFSAHGMILRPVEKIVDYNFFALFIASDYFFDEAIRISVGSLSPTINWKDLRKLEFELPDLETQRKAAKILWSINDTITLYKEMMIQSDELLKSKFDEMFSNCERVRLGDYTEQIRGVSYKPIDLGDALDESHTILLRANNILNNEINFIDVQYVNDSKVQGSQAIRTGDILICGSSGSKEHLGKAAICNFEGKYTFGAFCKLLRITKYFSPIYVAEYFRSEEYRNYILKIACGSNINNLRNEHLDNILLPFPTKEKMNEFEEFVKKIEKSKLSLLEGISKLEMLYKRIMNIYLKKED